MPTVSKKIADLIVANNGVYPGDHEVCVKILKYGNIFDGADAYKLIYHKDDQKYIENHLACRWKEVYWQRTKPVVQRSIENGE